MGDVQFGVFPSLVDEFRIFQGYLIVVLVVNNQAIASDGLGKAGRGYAFKGSVEFIFGIFHGGG